MKSIKEDIKRILRKIPIIYSLNARLKAKRILDSYRALNAHYQEEAQRRGLVYRERDVSNTVWQRLKGRGIKIEPIPKGKLRIFFVGTVAEQDFGGIIQGIRKFGEVIIFEREPGGYGQMPRVEAGDWAKNNALALIDQVQGALKFGPIHAVIGQMWAYTMTPFALEAVEQMGIPVINISMDDRHAFRGRKISGKWLGTSGLIGSIDLTCTTAKECCLWYMVEGYPAIYLPEASDPELYKSSSASKLYEVSFVGANYGIRAEIVEAIEERGIEITCYGNGWPNGKIDVEKVPELFAQSRIILGVGTIGHCTDFYSLKMRDFDGPMSGSLYLTHDNPDLYDLFDVGKEIVTYRTPMECADRVAYYLNHPDEADAIAKAGRARVVREHTWEKRFEKIFQVMGILKGNY